MRFNEYGTIQRSQKPTTYRTGKAPKTTWCIACGIQRRASVAVGVNEDGDPCCQEHVAKQTSEAPTFEEAV